VTLKQVFGLLAFGEGVAFCIWSGGDAQDAQMIMIGTPIVVIALVVLPLLPQLFRRR
jgi:hypothetical protein